MDLVRAAQAPEMVECLRHEGEGCSRCDGSCYRPPSSVPGAASPPRRSSRSAQPSDGKRHGPCRCTAQAAIPALRVRGWVASWTSVRRKIDRAGVPHPGFSRVLAVGNSDERARNSDVGGENKPIVGEKSSAGVDQEG